MRFISAHNNQRLINVTEIVSFEVGTKEIVARLHNNGIAVIYQTDDPAKLAARWQALQAGIEMGHGLINIQ